MEEDQEVRIRAIFSRSIRSSHALQICMGLKARRRFGRDFCHLSWRFDANRLFSHDSAKAESRREEQLVAEEQENDDACVFASRSLDIQP